VCSHTQALVLTLFFVKTHGTPVVRTVRSQMAHLHVQAWVKRPLNMSAELVQLRKMPLLRVLDFTLRHVGPFAYADLSAPVFLCAKPLDLEDSDRRLAHLGKRQQVKVECTAGQCNKRFRPGEDLYAHLLEHPEFSHKSVDEQEQFLDRILEEYVPAPATFIALMSSYSLSLVPPEAAVFRTIGFCHDLFYTGEVQFGSPPHDCQV